MVLLTSEAAEMLAAAVEPAELKEVRCHQVVCRLGESLTVSYQCLLEGERQGRLLVARAGGRLPSQAAILSDGGERLALWAYPDDPYLPGLSAVLDHRLPGLLNQVGVAGAPTSAEVRSYLAARRAVVEVRTARDRLFVKSVRPHTVDRLLRLPVPGAVGWLKEMGLVVMRAMPGVTLWEHLSRGGVGPQPQLLIELLDSIPPLPGGPPPLPAQVANHVKLLSLLVPDRAKSLEEMVEVIERAPEEQRVPVHGDLHSGQIIMDAGRPIGLIDFDRAGMGLRADDLAGLLAHLTVAGLADGYVTELWEAFSQTVDPTSLRLRAAAAILGFAPTAFIAQKPHWPADVRHRIDMAISMALH